MYMVYAGFGTRLLARLIDALILFVPMVIISRIFPYASFIVAILYYPVFLSSPLKGTPGNAIMRTAVVTTTGQQLPFLKSIIRYVVSFVSAMLLFFGYLMSLFTEKKQTFHDLIAETLVIVQDPPANLNYFDVWRAHITDIFRLLSKGEITTTPSLSAPEATSSSQSAGPTAATEATEAIESLHKLYQSGAITLQEYESKKQELLAKI
jgi:uncharacterized RDD family membrane protein YckC